MQGDDTRVEYPISCHILHNLPFIPPTQTKEFK